ncbi:cytochrome C oxidase subunit IV family protein [Flavobacterium sp.]|jgi:hypothetical protein|uniref:cytochrome C oxidase subunit IV family protein n=1 Tax=Flavobacterium sp. TaxID=239 RepID=UPI0037BE52EA
MKKSFVFTYISLLLLTATTALIASSSIVSKVVVFLILGISVLKIVLVAFQFMELKKANSFWKTSLISVLILILAVIFGILLTGHLIFNTVLWW